MQEIKRILKMTNSEIFYKIIKISGLDEREKILLQESILRGNNRNNICELLNISCSTFRNIRNNALLKIKIALTNLLDEKINFSHKKINLF